jgi:hypothetical protein
MAHKQNPTGDERSEVEFLYFKGKLHSADIQALVSGFASSRPSALPASRAAAKRIAAPTTDNGAAGAVDQEVDLDLVDDAEVAQEEVSSAPRVARGSGPKRTYPTPDTVDIDLDSGEKPFRTFAAEKAPQTHHDKYLVAAEWVRAYRGIPEIGAGHVRTCYIGAGWDFDVVDPLQPFRKLKKAGLGTISDGKFAIKHLGTSEVSKMNASATAT